MKQVVKNFLSKPNKVLSWLQKTFKQDVLIFVNNGNRDTLGLVAVYAQLKYRYGLRVKIKSMMFLERFWSFLCAPDVVVHISIDSPDSLEMYRRLNAMGVSCIMSPTESFVWANPIHFVSRYDYKNLISGVLLAVEGMKNVLVSHNKVLKSQVRVVGFPTFDWGAPLFRKWLLSREKFYSLYDVSPEKKKIIFLASSFSMADIDIAEWDTKYSHWNITKDEALKQIQASKGMREKTIQYFSQLLEEHQDWQLLIKKHPVEKEDAYSEAWGTNPQVTSVHNVEIYDLLNISDVLVHWNSTTSVQAWSFAKPTILLWFEESDIFAEMYKGDPLVDFADPKKGNFICKTYFDLENALDMVLCDNAIPVSQELARKNFVKQWFYALDGQSSQRAAKAIYDFWFRAPREVSYDIKPLDILVNIKKLVLYGLHFYILRLFFLFNLPAFWYVNLFGKEYDYFYTERQLLRFERKLQQELM